MKVFVVTESMEDGRGGSWQAVRGVYSDYNWAVAKSYNIPIYDIEEWEVDENNFNTCV